MHWRSKLIHPGTHAPSHFRSLAMPTYRGSTVVFEQNYDGRLVRLNVGLEDPSDLIADLNQALNTMDAPA
jgi:cystathionine beta-lyase/cystathionine gamma-synthase